MLSGFSNNVKKLFLSLPSRLYSQNLLTQDVKIEKLLLNKKHILSSNFNITPFIVVDKNNNIISRCILTYYPNDDNAYVGLFESFNIPEASKLLLKSVQEKAKHDEKKKLIGPLDASFWIGYRFKTNNFESIYTAEPYGKSYYVGLWKEFGFTVRDRYFSNKMDIPKKEDTSMKCKLRLQMIEKKGYIMKHSSKKTFYSDIENVYELLTKVYSQFPLYKDISKTQFIKMFYHLKYILDFDMVKLVYKNQKLAGFFIAIPNYYNLLNNINLKTIVKILKIKKNPKEYVLLYTGIGHEHAGLGSAMAELIKEELVRKQCKSIAALIHEGKVTNHYYKELEINQYEYVLLEKILV